MKLSTTEFRKNLFQLVDRAIEGELVEITSKTHTIRLVVDGAPTKLSRLIKRDTLNCKPEQLEQAQLDLNKEMSALWDAKWHNRL